ncbi:MAG: hypothetical protein JWO98_5164 [Frankiales bacterium]|nr:hypothetical protein [Frankiales bacterium]
MSDHRDAGPRSFRHLDLREKQEYLRVLCDVVREMSGSWRGPGPSATPW